MLHYSDTTDAAKFLGLQRFQVINYIEAGTLKADKFGCQYAIHNSDLLDFANRRANNQLPKRGRPKKQIFQTCTTVSPQFDIAVVLGKSEPMQLVIDNPTE